MPRSNVRSSRHRKRLLSFQCGSTGKPLSKPIIVPKPKPIIVAPIKPPAPVVIAPVITPQLPLIKDVVEISPPAIKPVKWDDSLFKFISPFKIRSIKKCQISDYKKIFGDIAVGDKRQLIDVPDCDEPMSIKLIKRGSVFESFIFGVI